MKKEMVAGIGVVMLMGGTVGTTSVSVQAAEQSSHPNAEAKPANPQAGKRLEFLNQYAYQFHQLNALRSERLELKEQIVDKRDHLVDLIIAAKKIGNKTLLKQAKGVKRQLKTLNAELKALSTEAHNEKQVLKEAMKNHTGIETEQFNKLLSTNRKINEKLKEKDIEIDRMIDILN